MNHLGDCITCIQFRKECPNGVQEPNPEGFPPWDGTDGGCSYWMGELCTKCKNNVKNEYGRRRCSKGTHARSEFFENDGQCIQYEPMVRQATLEGF